MPLVSNLNAALDNLPAPATDDDVIWRDLRGQLDQEIARLPECHRRAIVLCYLEGKTQDEAARLLGWPKGTVATRLKRARERLYLRLSRRGWAVSSVTLAGVLTGQALASAIPAELVRSTLGGALAYAAGPVAAGAVLSAKSLALTEGVLRIMWYSKMKFMASVFLAVVLAGSGVGLAVRQAWAGAGPDEAEAPQAAPISVIAQVGGGKKVGAGGKGTASSAEVADLRREVETLRRDLETALKEINDLKAGVRNPALPPEQGPFYRGRPAHFWLEQLKDGDPSYRVDAVLALGVLAERQKSLVPVLVTALKDKEHNVRSTASNALGRMGPEVVPALHEVLKDKTAVIAYSDAIDALRKIGPEGKVILPLLSEFLQGKDISNWRSTIAFLVSLGPEARPAMPALIDALGHSVQLFKNPKSKKQDFSINIHSSLPAVIVNALLKIDPDIENVLSPDWVRLFEGGSTSPAATPELLVQLQKLYEQLKKKYVPMEK